MEVVAGVEEEVAEAEEAGEAEVAGEAEEAGVEEAGEAEDICIDLGGVITEDGIDDLYCGVTGMLGLACLLIGLYHVIVSEVVPRMDVLFPEQD